MIRRLVCNRQGCSRLAAQNPSAPETIRAIGSNSGRAAGMATDGLGDQSTRTGTARTPGEAVSQSSLVGFGT